jgi:hypothetical protein
MATMRFMFKGSEAVTSFMREPAFFRCERRTGSILL